MEQNVLKDISTFLGCATPELWVDEALKRIPELLTDHVQCEKKAAYSALQLMFRYPEDEELAIKMSKLAREELRHFEQVLKIMQQKGVSDRKQTAARYAAGLKQHIRKSEPGRLVDSLIVGAFIEARSCERFACLIPYLEVDLAQFYQGLLASEGRHYQVYLGLAKKRWQKKTKLKVSASACDKEFIKRVAEFRHIEKELIESVDTVFRFHSGVPTKDHGCEDE